MKYKFRGLRKDGEGWVYGNLSEEYDGTCFISYWRSVLIEPENNYYEMVNFNEEVLPETVGQFTGFLDKNGNEIFEGDIMFNPHNQCHKKYFEVIFACGGYDARYFQEGNYTLSLAPVLKEFNGCIIIKQKYE